MRAINSFKYALGADIFGTHMIAMILEDHNKNNNIQFHLISG